MNSTAPISKVNAGGIGGAVTIIVIYSLQQFAHVTVDATLATAITTVVTFALAYLWPSTVLKGN